VWPSPLREIQNAEHARPATLDLYGPQRSRSLSVDRDRIGSDRTPCRPLLLCTNARHRDESEE
jgi:hypothetical protein